MTARIAVAILAAALLAPAACEHIIFRRRDRAALQSGDFGGLPLATVIDNVHCNSWARRA